MPKLKCATTHCPDCNTFIRHLTPETARRIKRYKRATKKTMHEALPRRQKPNLIAAAATTLLPTDIIDLTKKKKKSKEKPLGLKREISHQSSFVEKTPLIRQKKPKRRTTGKKRTTGVLPTYSGNRKRPRKFRGTQSQPSCSGTVADMNSHYSNSDRTNEIFEPQIEQILNNQLLERSIVEIGENTLRVVGDLRLLAIRSNTSNRFLDDKLIGYLEDQLWQLTDAPDVPRFGGAMFVNGVLLIRGTDSESTKWLRFTIDCIPPIDGVRFLTSDEDFICKLVRAFVFIPGKNREISEILKRLGKQNPGLTPEIWSVFSWTPTAGGSNLIIDIDEDNARILYNKYNMELCLSIWKIYFRFDM